MQKGLQVIDNETERLSGMVEELLDFSRIQNGKLSLVKTRMDILAELGEAVVTVSYTHLLPGWHCAIPATGGKLPTGPCRPRC